MAYSSGSSEYYDLLKRFRADLGLLHQQRRPAQPSSGQFVNNFQKQALDRLHSTLVQQEAQRHYSSYELGSSEDSMGRPIAIPNWRVRERLALYELVNEFRVQEGKLPLRLEAVAGAEPKNRTPGVDTAQYVLACYKLIFDRD